MAIDSEEKLNKWLKESKLLPLLNKVQSKLDFELTPSLSLFGIISVSFGEIGTNPDEWRDELKEKITHDFLEKIGISLEEYSNLLIKEVKELASTFKKDIADTLNQYKKEFEEIVRLIKENPVLTLDEFRRREIQKEYKFVGRNEELKELHDFLKNPNEKIKVIFGEGGAGKTRLSIKFAEEIKNLKDWDVYFINRYKDFYPINIYKNTLLILDEAIKHKDRNKLYDFILNASPEGYLIKLLLIIRPIFIDSIKSELVEMSISFNSSIVAKGDIFQFLNENYKQIEEDKIIKIEQECGNSFVWASFLAEYFLEKGKIGKLEEVLDNRVTKYMKDIEHRIKKDISDIKNIFYLISLVTPIDWGEDKKYFKEELSQTNYEILDSIINVAEFSQSDLLFFFNNRYEIKPDLIVEYLILKSIKDKVFDKWANKFSSYMPFRISYNVFLTKLIEEKTLGKTQKFLEDVWDSLNKEEYNTPEYFLAIILYTGTFRHGSFCDISRANLKKWKQNYKKITDKYPEKEVRESFTMSLVNAGNIYGEKGDTPKVEVCLEELRTLHKEHPEKKVKESFAMSLVNAGSFYGKNDDTPKVERCLEELRTLHGEHPEKEVREKLASGLVNAGHFYGKKDDTPNMERCLEELRALHREYPEKEVRKIFVKVLVYVGSIYGEKDDTPKVEVCLEELRALHREYPEKEIRKILARVLVYAGNFYGKKGDLLKVQGCLEELRTLHKEHPEKEARKEFARVLYCAGVHYAEEGHTPNMERCLEELRTLHGEYPEKEARKELASALLYAGVHYAEKDDLSKVKEFLSELEKLYNQYKDEELKEIIEKAKEIIY
jgi:hypothetical protein